MIIRKKPIRRGLSLALALVMALSLATTAFAARFTDVPVNEWYYNDVEYAVQNGLVSGTSPTTYAPDKNLTYAEAVKLAAAMHKKVTAGNTDFAAGSPWYQPYVDYAKANKIITKDYIWTNAATRAGYMEIFAGAIPDTGLMSGYRALEPINTVDDNAIPDVSCAHPQAAAIYKLYRAGIVQGNDAAYSCSPDSPIRRSEVAAILTRMMNSAKRVTFTLSNAGELKLTQQPQDVTTEADQWVIFAVAVSGGRQPYTYQWQINQGSGWNNVGNNNYFQNTTGAAMKALITGQDFAYGIEYRCVVKDADGRSVTSNAAKPIEKTSVLAIAQQPQNAIANVNDWVTFTVAVSGGKAPYTYQWQYSPDGGLNWGYPVDSENGYLGSKTDTLKVKVGVHEEEYAYRCLITDASGKSATSDAAKVTLRNSTITRPAAPLAITAQPQNVSANVNDWATFTVAVSGGKAPYTYQWQYSPDGGLNWGYPVDSENGYLGSKTDTLKVKVGVHEEEYAYRCLITDASGESVTSNTVKVKMSSTITRPSSKPLTITSQPENMTAKVSEWASFTVAVSGGTGNYTYQWQWSQGENGKWNVVSNSDVMKGQGTNTFRTQVVGPGEDEVYYRCIVSDGTTSVISDTAHITYW